MSRILSLLIFLFISNAWAVRPLPGLIPLDYVKRPATDLMYQGQNITPQEAHELVLRHEGNFDLSELNPDHTTNIWKDEPPRPVDVSLDNLAIEYQDIVDYVSPVLSRSGNFRFTVTKPNQFGVPELFTIMASKRAHNVLLRKALLRKLGFVIPPVKHLQRVQIRFKNRGEAEAFRNRLSADTFGSPERWVVMDKEDENILMLQDVVAMPDLDRIYNLSVGHIPGQLVRGRRLLRSLIVPYAMTNTPESVNLFSWTPGRIVSNNLSLQHDDAANYDCSWEDAKWIAKRIFRLTRQDWLDIASEGKFPPSVERLVAEKLISRRNELGPLLKMDVADIPFEPQVSNGEYLVNGQLTKEDWDGYASRFSYGDPENPLSSSEITSFIGSEAISLGLNAVTSAINSIPYLGTNLDDQLAARAERLAADAMANNVVNGASANQELGAFVLPIVRGKINVNRRIIAGNYLGTNNRIQLVDVMGISLSGGAFVGIDGIPSPFNVSVTAQAQVSRNYAHVKPITSLKKALKYPFKNIMVPLLKRKYGKSFNDLVDANLDELEPLERSRRINEALSLFNENMEVGESLILTDTVSIGAALTGGVSLYSLINVSATINPNEVVISRIHITRKDENNVHIYRDIGNLHQLRLGLAFRAVVPVLRISGDFSTGRAWSKFYKVNIDPQNPDIVKNLLALRRALFTSSLKQVKELEKPYELKYKVDEGRQSVGLLVWRYDRINNSAKIEVTHPLGEKKNVYRKYKGYTFGNDYTGYALEALASLPSLFLKSGYIPPSLNTAGNPGNNFFGSAVNKIMTYEGLINEDGVVDRPFVKVSRIWNGWSAKKKKALKIIKKIKDRYKFRFYPESVLNETEKLFLYNFNVNLHVYQSAINHMFNLNEKDIKKIFSDNQNKKRLLFKGTTRFLSYRKKFHKARRKGQLTRMSDITLRALSIAEKKLSVQGLGKLFGGEENFYLVSRLDGFRIGDENGDEPYISNAIGEFGEENMAGPLATMMNFMQISEGEFYVSWLLGRLL